MIGPYSPKLTLPEKAALRAIEDGDVENGTSSFLAASFMLVRQALAPHFDEVDLNAVLALRTDDAAPDLLSIRKIFWEAEELTPWGELFLTWEEEFLTDSELALGIEDINDYLVRSADFYEALKIDFQSDEARIFESSEAGIEPLPVEVRVLNSEVIDDLTELDSPEELLEAHESAFEEVVDEILDGGGELQGSSWDTIKVETIYWPKTTQNQLEGKSWDTIRVEKIYWPKAAAEEESEVEKQSRQKELDEAGEFGGSSWDSIKIETIYWPKPGERTETEAAEVEQVQAAEVPVAQYPIGPERKLKDTVPVSGPPESESPAQTELKQSESAPVPAATVEEEPDEGEEIVTARAPGDPFRGQNRLVVKNKYLGYGKNAQGVLGLCGQLIVSYFKEGELSGRLESSNPLLFLSSKRLSGKKSVVTYWLPPVAFPHPAGSISIETPLESKTMSLHTLFPKSRTDLMRDRSVVMCLFLPALIGFLYFAFVYVLTAHGIDQEAQLTFPELYSQALAGIDSGDFRSQGLGLYRLRVIPASESMQMIWAAVIFLAPLVSSKFFYYLSHRRKRQFGGLLATVQLLPTILLLSTWSFQDKVFPLYSHQDFAPLDLRGFLLWSVVMNLLVAVYLFLSVFGYWDRTIKRPEIRFALPFVLTGLYMLVMFIVIYGRSWFS